MFNLRVFVAEFIGTFALVFIGAGAGVVGISGLLGVALAHGFVVAVFAYAYGPISGSHINPAVTFSMALNNTIRWAEAVTYWIAQFAGAILAAYLLTVIVDSVNLGGIESGATRGTLTEPAPYIALVVEIILTFFLVNTILHTDVEGNGGPLAGLAIGLTLVFAILAGGPMTGASLNPARTLGPALFTGSASDPMTYVIYFAGPLIGAALAVGVYKFLSRNAVLSPSEAANKVVRRK
jgi:MIP family channel proteins